MSGYNFNLPINPSGLRGLAVQHNDSFAKYQYVIKHTDGDLEASFNSEEDFKNALDNKNNCIHKQIVWDDGSRTGFQECFGITDLDDEEAFNKCKQLTFEEFYNLVNKKDKQCKK